jgi:ABC-type transport system involved in multi-copper enzyme maturation permease subunit
MTRETVPSSAAVLMTLVRVTFLRLLRGRAVWVSVLIAALPILLALAQQGRGGAAESVTVVQFFVLALLPPMFVASSLGEEIEERTTTYLWSRPIGRWTIVVGKLIALAPIAMFLCVGGWIAATQIVTGAPPSGASIVAFAAGSLAISVMSSGLSTLVPRHGMALSIVYLVIFDLSIGAIPASIQNISITRQVRLLANLETGSGHPAIAMAVIAGIWLAVALWRIRRLES